MNPFKRGNSTYKTNNKVAPKPIYNQEKINIETEFPVLGYNNQKVEKEERESVSFLEITSRKKVEIVEEEDPLEPGWMSLKYEGNKIIRKNNFITDTKEKDEYEEIQEAMNKAVQEIDKRRQKYVDYYNELHGEGEYENKYVNHDMYISSDEEIDNDSLHGEQISD